MALCCDNSTVSRTDAVKECLVAASVLDERTVAAIHAAAGAWSFIKPETALLDPDAD